MAACSACGASTCIDCGETVDPSVYRCDSCLYESESRDPWRSECIELRAAVARLKKQSMDKPGAREPGAGGVTEARRGGSGSIPAQPSTLLAANLAIAGLLAELDQVREKASVQEEKE